MLSFLTEELVKRGYDISLFASGDSVTASDLKVMTSKGLWLQRGLRSPHAVIMKMLRDVYAKRAEFDLIHSHAEFFMYPLLFGGSPVPVLTTLHRPMDDEAAQAAMAFPDMNFCAISEDHKKRIEAKGVKVFDVVYNGIDVGRYRYNDEPEDYFLFLGRLNKEKGVVDAISSAQMAGVKLVVAGNIVGGNEWQYFFNEVQPLLNASNIKFVGEVDFAEKVKLMRGAKALLFPIDRDEPFGLVMIEAMACGTPVIAYDRGSVKEVVVGGVTGTIVNDMEGMAGSMGGIGSLGRIECRKHVENKFTLKMMVDKYEEIYKKLFKK
jgi:glycosyltransferase involved in cell wall biosynthesis